MFSRFETALKLTALCLILGLCGWTWYQSQKISSLKAENQAQAQTIKQQEDANKALNIALQQERDAVIAQQQRNDEIERVKQSLRHNLVLTLVCLSLLLTACTNKVTTKAEYIYPPQAYTAPCVKTAFTGETYGDVVIQLVKVTAERDKCASQVDNLNKWINQAKGSK